MAAEPVSRVSGGEEVFFPYWDSNGGRSTMNLLALLCRKYGIICHSPSMCVWDTRIIIVIIIIIIIIVIITQGI